MEEQNAENQHINHYQTSLYFFPHFGEIIMFFSSFIEI